MGRISAGFFVTNGNPHRVANEADVIDVLDADLVGPRIPSPVDLSAAPGAFGARDFSAWFSIVPDRMKAAML